MNNKILFRVALAVSAPLLGGHSLRETTRANTQGPAGEQSSNMHVFSLRRSYVLSQELHW